jgi:hypothetical protein
MLILRLSKREAYNPQAFIVILFKLPKMDRLAVLRHHAPKEQCPELTVSSLKITASCSLELFLNKN